MDSRQAQWEARRQKGEARAENEILKEGKR